MHNQQQVEEITDIIQQVNNQWHGVAETAKAYYEWSGGKAFLGIDSLANYIIVASVQTGNDIYKLQDGQVTFSFDQDLARILWDELYVPYVKGYYANLGKFRSDDEKTGPRPGRGRKARGRFRRIPHREGPAASGRCN